MLTKEQVIAAQKAQIEAFHELTTHYVSTVEKLTELNLRLAKDCLQDSVSCTNNMLDSMAGQGQKEPSSHLAIMGSLFPKLSEYSRHLVELTSSMGHQFNKIFSSHTDNSQKQLERK